MAGECDKERRYCPYCDAEVAEAAFPYCEACKVELFNCPKCRKAIARTSRVCPSRSSIAPTWAPKPCTRLSKTT